MPARSQKRGRPRKAEAKTPAERQKAYRQRQKAAGLVVRPIAPEDRRLDERERERFRNALRENAYLDNEVKRLRAELDRMHAELIREQQYHAVTLKDLIVTRDKLSLALAKKSPP